MDKITKFDKNNCQAVRMEIDAALKLVGDKLGISIRTGNGSFLDTSFSLKLEIACIGESGEIEGREVDTFKQLHQLYGLQATDLHRQFKSGGRNFELMGINSRKRKNPILAKCVEDGKRYLFPVKSVKVAWGYKIEEFEL